MTIRAGSAESLVSVKQQKKLVRLEKKRAEKTVAAEVAVSKSRDGKEAGAEDVGEADDKDEDLEMDSMDDKRTTGRVIVVDWAPSKEKWKEEKAKIEEEVGSASGSNSESSSSDGSDDQDNLGGHGGGEDGELQPAADDEDTDG